MPGLSGWDFLEKYRGFSQNLKNKVLIFMLSTSENPDDIARSRSFPEITKYFSKPMSMDLFKEIKEDYFDF